jgi:hypothetical protein
MTDPRISARARWFRAGLAGAVVAGGVASAGFAVTARDTAAPAAHDARERHEERDAVAVPEARPERVPPAAGEVVVSTDTAVAAPVAEPVAGALPGLGIRSVLDPLGLQPTGELQAPPRWDVAGWYVGSPRPGERGPAVIAGHVDGPDGPAVFWRLGQVRAGDRVEVLRADGTTAVFAVTRTLVVPKSGFPTSEVYGPTPGAELRLITCGGPFDRRSGHYVDNLIVFATEVLP